jgi:hypothetical protein
MNTTVTGTAIRHPKRGKAHRTSAVRRPLELTQTRCGKWARDMTESVPVKQTAPEDRCRICWPTTTP